MVDECVIWASKVKKVLMVLAGGVFLVVVGSLLFRSCLRPSHDRPWRVDNARLAHAITTGEQVTLHNVRDWRYDEEGVVSEDWITEEYDLSALKDMWFIMEPFSSLEAVGHGMLMFDFEDGKTVLVSVEARKESDESFSAWKGVLNQFELIYLWGTQEDFLVRRAVVQAHPLRIHRLNLKRKTVRDVFLALLRQTNHLQNHPRFYNTIRHNCTNKLAHAANEANPGSVPKSLSYVLTGYADKTLYKAGLIHGLETWQQQEAGSYVHDFISESYTSSNWPEQMRRRISP